MGRSGSKTHRRGAIWTERMLLGLIVVSLAGTLNLLIAVHRRALTDRRMTISEASSVAKAAAPAPAITAQSEIKAPIESPAPAPKIEPPAPAEDATKKAIASLAAATAKEMDAVQAADKRTGDAGSSLPDSRRRVGAVEKARDARAPADLRHHGRCREAGARRRRHRR